VYLVTEVPSEDMSGWVLSCAEHVFRDFEGLRSFLASETKSVEAQKIMRNAHA